MSVFTDVELMDGHDDTNYTDCFPPALNPAAAQALEEIDKHTLLTCSVGIAASVLAPGKRPFTVARPFTFHVSSGHQHDYLLRRTAQQHGITLTGVLQPCGGCLEVNGIRAGTPRRTTSRAERPMGDRPYRFVRPLRGVPGRVSAFDHVRGQRFEVDADIRFEEKI